jgi:AcrR family transcriptional regulator
LTEQERSSKSRGYTMRKRAEDVEATRRRIVDAAVRLHGTVGPAATSIAAIAAEAGVTRLTVYRHFPDDEALFGACTMHWLSQQVPPDPAAWTAVADPEERLRVALTDLYRFYRDGEAMLTLSHRDREAMPEGQRRRLAERDRYWRDLLVEPFRTRGARRRRVTAVIGHAIAFPTWRSLCAEQGLSNPEAVEAMTTLALAVSAGTR